VLTASFRISRASTPLALRINGPLSSSRAAASLRSEVQEQSRGADSRRTITTAGRFLLKLWDISLGRVLAALINFVKGIFFGKKGESLDSSIDSTAKFLYVEKDSVLPSDADVLIDAAADEVVRERQNLLEARRFMEQKLREIDGRPMRVTMGLQAGISNREAVDAAGAIEPLNIADGTLPLDEVTSAMSKNGPVEETTLSEYKAIDTTTPRPDEEAIAADSQVPSDAVTHDMTCLCGDVILLSLVGLTCCRYRSFLMNQLPPLRDRCGIRSSPKVRAA